MHISKCKPFPHTCVLTHRYYHIPLLQNNTFIAIQDAFKTLKTAWNMRKNNELKNETKNGYDELDKHKEPPSYIDINDDTLSNGAPCYQWAT